ncbi:MAG: CidA/LrgA family protein [Tissierellia bacterium]|nr:CidA/LrgA family protein [Tissierellia bacterium]
MKIIKEFGIIFLCLLLGNITKLFINFPIPDTVYGMIYFFIALIMRFVKVKDVAIVSSGLLDNMQFFLIPPSVAIVNVYGLIQADLFKFVAIVSISMFLTMGVTAMVVSLTQKVMRNDK